MSQALTSPAPTFLDRRRPEPVGEPVMSERRQFTNSHDELSPAARELAMAIDAYKLRHRRRFITYDEIMGVIESLGYRRG